MTQENTNDSFKRKLRELYNDICVNPEIVKKYKKEYEELAQIITETFDTFDEQEFQKTLDDENKLYECESLEDKISRARNKESWVFFEQKHDVEHLDYVELCLKKSDHYYGRHPNRSGLCEIYRLKGTKNIFLCDQCLNDIDMIQFDRHFRY